MNGLIASQHLLAVWPLWQTFVMFGLLPLALVYLGRLIFEGKAYNVAYCSVFGIPTMAVSVTIAANVIKRGHIQPEWITSTGFHWSCAIVACAIGLIASFKAIQENTWNGSE